MPSRSGLPQGVEASLFGRRRASGLGRETGPRRSAPPRRHPERDGEHDRQSQKPHLNLHIHTILRRIGGSQAVFRPPLSPWGIGRIMPAPQRSQPSCYPPGKGARLMRSAQLPEDGVVEAIVAAVPRGVPALARCPPFDRADRWRALAGHLGDLGGRPAADAAGARTRPAAVHAERVSGRARRRPPASCTSPTRRCGRSSTPASAAAARGSC